MVNEITKPKPTKRVLIGIGCAVIISVIIGLILPQTGNQTTIPTASLSSGPFSIDSSNYNIGDKITFTGIRIPQGLLGEVVFIQPDGKTHHTLPIDGSKKPSISHYFKLLPQTTKNCIPQNYIGTWEISFRTLQGEVHSLIRFNVSYDKVNSEGFELC